MMGRKDRGALRKMFGAGEDGPAEAPKKMGNVRLSSLANGNDRGCSRCFPHGVDTDNCTARKNRRSWKYHRKTRYKNKEV